MGWGGMTLGEVIEFLERYEPEAVVRNGFDGGHSDRGSYADLAFEPAQNVTVGYMLDHARKNLGRMHYGYKGGEYVMTDRSRCLIGTDDSVVGDEITPTLLRLMFEDVPRRDDIPPKTFEVTYKFVVEAASKEEVPFAAEEYLHSTRVEPTSIQRMY